ncbi:hypothetical protein H5410_022135, partial [Solanum commersonii]
IPRTRASILANESAPAARALVHGRGRGCNGVRGHGRASGATHVENEHERHHLSPYLSIIMSLKNKLRREDKPSLLQLLARLYSVPLSGVLPSTLGYPITVGAVPSIAPLKFATPPISSSATMLVGFPAMGWEYFTKVFIERFVPYSLRDQCRDEFDRLEQGSLSVSKYEVASMSCLVMPCRGFTSYLQKATTSLMLSSGTFQSIIDHVTMIKCIQHAKQGSRPLQAAIQSLDGISGSKPSQTSQGMPSEYPCQGGRANPSGYFQWGLGPVVILFVRSWGTRQRIAPNTTRSTPAIATRGTSHSTKGGDKGTKGGAQRARDSARRGS